MTGYHRRMIHGGRQRCQWLTTHPLAPPGGSSAAQADLKRKKMLDMLGDLATLNFVFIPLFT
ncbi:hypothetical protein Taro_007642 [Colocasia esculenta]|uniref:Uncharacterized protein n=1 Tax=Colocasia esculenta TaxID=4460 RepID=A0A843U100_COLES|nr:hypothetical protein [Colocasia esculenta]